MERSHIHTVVVPDQNEDEGHENDCRANSVSTAKEIEFNLRGSFIN